MTEPAPDPKGILEIATGYMAAKQLFAANRIGLIRTLADGPRTADQLAAATEVPVRTARILADTLASLGLLNRTGKHYALGVDAAAYLTGEHAELDLGPFLTFLNEISYPHWLGFDRSVDTAKPGGLALDGPRWETFLSGVMTYNALHARMLARAFDFTPYRNLLDLGGLSSAFAVEAMRINTDLRTTFAYEDKSVDAVREAVHEADVAERSTVIGGNTPSLRPTGEYDLVMVNHVLHRFSPDDNVEILGHARAAASAGARLVLLDFVLDSDQDPRPLDALHAAEYLTIDGTVVPDRTQVRDWLDATGWRLVDELALSGSPRALIAEPL